MKNAWRSLPAMIADLDAIVAQPFDPHAFVDVVQHRLPELLHSPNVLAPEYTRPAAESYARHLVRLHPRGLYTMVVMVWLPGQGTPIHDHGGVDCIEGVYEGQMLVTPYDVTPIDHQRVRAVPGEPILADRGDVRALIPPHEYHVMANTTQETAITLHVYRGELNRCHVFVDAGDGTYHIKERALGYTKNAQAAPLLAAGIFTPVA